MPESMSKARLEHLKRGTPLFTSEVWELIDEIERQNNVVQALEVKLDRVQRTLEHAQGVLDA